MLLSAMLIRSFTYGPTIAQLVRRFHVLAVELPGSGRGSRLSVPWSFEQYADWTARLLDALGLERITLIGHSSSGAVALIMGACRPERIGRLCLVNPVGIEPPGSVLDLVLGHLPDIPREPRFTLRAAPAFTYNLCRHTRNVVNQIRLPAHADLTGYASRTRLPTLIAWGARDRTVPVRNAHVLHQLVAGSSLYVSETGSHDWLIEEAERFAEVVTAFTGQRSQ